MLLAAYCPRKEEVRTQQVHVNAKLQRLSAAVDADVQLSIRGCTSSVLLCLQHAGGYRGSQQLSEETQQQHLICGQLQYE